LVLSVAASEMANGILVVVIVTGQGPTTFGRPDVSPKGPGTRRPCANKMYPKAPERVNPC